MLDPAKVAGKIVVCDRGVNARVNKSLAVQEAGGVGMILVNTSASSLNADFHFVPTVHLQSTDRAAVKAYAATAGRDGDHQPGDDRAQRPGPVHGVVLVARPAARRQRRPAEAGRHRTRAGHPGRRGAPGNSGKLFDLYSGTSMSSPHVAGLAALFKQKYPSWSPMAIKSALMTSAGDVLDGPNTNPLVIFRQGAGHVRPASR